MAPSPVRVDRSEAEKTDQAALMGAAVAAVLALVLGPGAWDLPASIFGLALILLLRGYFRITPPSPTELREEDTRTLERRARRKGYALAAVAGLCAGLALAFPLQLLAKVPVVHQFAERTCDVEDRVQQSESSSFIILRDASTGLKLEKDPATIAKAIAEDERKTMIDECVSGWITRWGIPAVWLLTVLFVPRIYLRRWRRALLALKTVQG